MGGGEIAEKCEVIIVDDGSTDKTKEVANQLIGRYPLWNIKCLSFPNGGVGKARNRGLEVAQGEYVWFVDPDDVIKEGSMELLLQLLDENPHVDGINFGFDISWYGKRTEYVRNFVAEERMLCDRDKLREKLIPFLMGYSQTDMDKLFGGKPLFRPNDYLVCKTVWQLVMRKRVLQDNGLSFREGMVLKEDSMFVLQFIVNCNTLLLIPDTLYHYLVRSSGMASCVHNVYSIYQNKTQVLEEKAKVSVMMERQGYVDAKQLYVGSLVLSALEIFVLGSKTGWDGCKYAKKFCKQPDCMSAVAKLNIGNAPFKYRVPIQLLKWKAFGFLYLLLYVAQKLGVKASV